MDTTSEDSSISHDPSSHGQVAITPSAITAGDPLDIHSTHSNIQGHSRTRRHLNESSSHTTVASQNPQVQEILEKIEDKIEEVQEQEPSHRPFFTRLVRIVNKKLKKVLNRKHEPGDEPRTSVLSVHPQHSPSQQGRRHSAESEGGHMNSLGGRLSNWWHGAQLKMGAGELLKELRLREAEYSHLVEEILTSEKPNTVYKEDHPYVALRKKIEAMSRTGKEEYRIQYVPLLNKPKLIDTKIPVYATAYDNERKKQANRRNFMFGLEVQDRYGPDQLDAYLYDPTEKPDAFHWRTKTESNIANLALVFSVSNLFRFPHATYINGGIIYYLVYCFLTVTLIRPLIFFEMLIGQFSAKGEWGFGRLHRYAKGFPHALTFVNVTFVTLNNAILGYAGIYAIGGYLKDPGECAPEWTGESDSCIPYNKVENEAERMMEKSAWIKNNLLDTRTGFQNATILLSTELFFRFYVLNWKGKMSSDSYHWKFVVAFMAVMAVIIPASTQAQLVSTISRIWIYFACILPIFLSAILFHQYAFRDGYNTPHYFSVPNWSRLGTLTLWRDAFEMAFTTVGVGYGLYIRVAAKNDFRFDRLNQASWLVSIFVMIFTLLCSMVVYTELAILGLIADAKEFTHIFVQGFGISFICLSGAILKSMPAWAFAIVFFGMIMFNIWPQIVVTQMSTEYMSGVLPIKKKSTRIFVGLALTILVEMILISIYAAHQEYAKSDSFDLYGGAGAASMMLLFEIGIAFVLYGFREFMTDMEIMLNRQMSFIYQCQMKYFIPPALVIALFMIGISWLSSPPNLDITHNIGSQTYWLGVLLNSAPVIIMAFFAFTAFRESNKVSPEIENTKLIEKTRGQDRYWKSKSRYMLRRGAVATDRKATPVQPSHQSLWTNCALKLDALPARDAYYLHKDLKRSLIDLFTKTRSKAKWKEITNKIIAKGKIRSLPQLARFIMRRAETKRLKQEVTFVRNLLNQCSVCDLATTSVKKLHGKYYSEQETILIDHLLKNTGIESSEEEICGAGDGNESEREEFGDENGVQSPEMPYNSSTADSNSMSSGDSNLIFRRIVGKLSPTDEEVKLDLVVRIKKALDLPCEFESAALRKLRAHRFYSETNAPWWSIINPPPEEHFITIKVTKRRSPVAKILKIRVIILRSRDHFVLRRLPVPRPPIVYATNEKLETFPGIDTRHKVSNLVIESIKRTLWLADLDSLGPENRTPLLDNMDMDIYSFIDPIRSCVVVLENSQELHRLENKWRWLTQPTRRQTPLDQIPDKVYMPFEIEEVTMARMNKRQLENERIDKMLAEPSDIIYHPPGKDYWSPDQVSPPPTRFSSSDDSEPEDFSPSPFYRKDVLPKVVLPHELDKHVHVQLVDETLLRQKRVEMQRALGGLQSRISPSMSEVEVKHLATAWRKQLQDPHVVVLHKNPEGIKTDRSKKYLEFKGLDEEQEAEEQQVQVPPNIVSKLLDDMASTRCVWSGACEMRSHGSRKNPKSIYSVHTVSSSTKSVKDFSNLKNDYEDLNYYTDGRTLIIEPAITEDVLTMANSKDSIASAMPTRKESRITLARTDATTKFVKSKENV